jgi:hypothetical protein
LHAILVFLHEMLPNDTRIEIENIVAGVILEGRTDHCTTIRNSFCRCYETSTVVKTAFESNAIIKKEQAGLIEAYCDEHNFWLENLPGEDRYLTRGGESKVYLANDDKHVIKLNDAIYYATWLEYINSILLHNIIFTNTSYRLLGFTKQDDTLFAVVEQVFIVADAQAELNDIKKFLEFNEFENIRRNDYENKHLGLILEDMHDENVIVNSETLFFIDSVFYTVVPHKT